MKAVRIALALAFLSVPVADASMQEPGAFARHSFANAAGERATTAAYAFFMAHPLER